MEDTHTRAEVANTFELEVWNEVGERVAYSKSHNGRTQAGGVAVANAQFAGTGVTAKYIGLTSNSGFAPANGDTTLSSEITTLGLGRVAGSVAIGSTQTVYNGTVQTVITATWSVTGSTTIYGGGLFTAVSSGTLMYENTCSATAVSNGYTVNATWTLNE